MEMSENSGFYGALRMLSNWASFAETFFAWLLYRMTH
jgi:hypothetical protein